MANLNNYICSMIYDAILDTREICLDEEKVLAYLHVLILQLDDFPVEKLEHLRAHVNNGPFHKGTILLYEALINHDEYCLNYNADRTFINDYCSALSIVEESLESAAFFFQGVEFEGKVSRQEVIDIILTNLSVQAAEELFSSGLRQWVLESEYPFENFKEKTIQLARVNERKFLLSLFYRLVHPLSIQVEGISPFCDGNYSVDDAIYIFVDYFYPGKLRGSTKGVFSEAEVEVMMQFYLFLKANPNSFPSKSYNCAAEIAFKGFPGLDDFVSALLGSY